MVLTLVLRALKVPNGADETSPTDYHADVFFNTVLVNALILATAPLLAVLMLGDLGFAPWQYALAFGAPCIGGLVGARLSPRLTARYGEQAILRGAGALRACWSLPLAFVFSGAGGLALVIVVQFGLVLSIGVFNPVYATFRLQQTPDDRVARTLAAWQVTSNATVAAMTALWGLLAGLIGTRPAIAAAGVALLATPLLLADLRLPGVPRAATATASSWGNSEAIEDGVPGERRADRLAGVKATASRRPSAGPDGLAMPPAT